MRRLLPSLAGLTAACSLFVDTGDLEGPSAASSDAGMTGDVTNTSEDASGAADADEDGTTVVLPDGATEGCDSIVADDFDTAALGVNWSSTVAVSGTVALTTNAPVSPPNALEITLSPPDSGPSPSAYLRKTFARAKRICCRFSLDAAVPGDPDTHRVLSLRGQGGNYGIILVEATGKLMTTEGYYAGSTGTPIDRIAASTPAPSGWKHMRVGVTLPEGPGIGSFTVEIGSVTVMQGTLGAADDDLGIDEIRFGSEYTQGKSLRLLRYDDVACGMF